DAVDFRGQPLPRRGRRSHPRFGGEGRRHATSAESLSTVDHRLTKGYSQPTMGVVQSMNGIRVRSLRHQAELLRYTKAEYLEFKFGGHGLETLVFRRQEIADSTEEILSDNGIRKRASDDLLGLWQTEP